MICFNISRLAKKFLTSGNPNPEFDFPTVQQPADESSDSDFGLRPSLEFRISVFGFGSAPAHFVARRASTAPPVIPALSPSLDATISTSFIVPGMA